eukprot:6318905-Amphidinium_carterae.1
MRPTGSPQHAHQLATASSRSTFTTKATTRTKRVLLINFGDFPVTNSLTISILLLQEPTNPGMRNRGRKICSFSFIQSLSVLALGENSFNSSGLGRAAHCQGRAALGISAPEHC